MRQTQINPAAKPVQKPAQSCFVDRGPDPV